MAVVVHQPNSKYDDEVDFLTYFKPFSLDTWIAILFICVIFVSFVFFTRYCKISQKKLKIKFFSVHPNNTLKHNYVVLILLITSVIFVNSYNTFLIASLTVEDDTETFKTLSDIVKFSKYKFLISKSRSFYKMLQKSNVSTYKRVFARLSSQSAYDKDVYQKAARENLVILTSSIYAIKKIQNHCELSILKKKYFRKGLYITFPKNSTLKTPFSKFITRLKSSGILEKLIHKYIPTTHRPNCQKIINKGNVQPLKLVEVAIPFLVLGLGIGLSLLLLIIEWMYSYKLCPK